jgi:TPR repeat protein
MLGRPPMLAGTMRPRSGYGVCQQTRAKAAAQSSLGTMYASGKGIQQDNAMAVIWYRKAADQGLASAQYILRVIPHVSKPKEL